MVWIIIKNEKLGQGDLTNTFFFFKLFSVYKAPCWMLEGNIRGGQPLLLVDSVK